MPKKPKIKWRDKDVNALKRAVKNFNAKIARLLKKEPNASYYLPKKVSASELRKSIEYRNDFNKLVSSLKRFSSKGAEKLTVFMGTPMTKWERREAAIAKAALNLRRTNKKKSLKPSAEKGTLGAEEEMSLRHKQYPKGKNINWEFFMKQLHFLGSDKYESQRAERYLNNYLSAVNNTMGRYKDVISILANRMGGMQLYYAYADNPNLQIDYVYPDGMSLNAKAQNIIDAFGSYGVFLTDEEKERYKYELELAEYGSEEHELEMKLYKEKFHIPDDI